MNKLVPTYVDGDYQGHGRQGKARLLDPRMSIITSPTIRCERKRRASSSWSPAHQSNGLREQLTSLAPKRRHQRRPHRLRA